MLEELTREKREANLGHMRLATLIFLSFDSNLVFGTIKQDSYNLGNVLVFIKFHGYHISVHKLIVFCALKNRYLS